MSGGASNNRITTKQFYENQLKTNKVISDLKDSQCDRMDEMERRILDEIKGVPKQVQNNTKEIDRLRKRSDIVDTIEGALGIVVAIFFGTRQ